MARINKTESTDNARSFTIRHRGLRQDCVSIRKSFSARDAAAGEYPMSRTKALEGHVNTTDALPPADTNAKKRRAG